MNRFASWLLAGAAVVVLSGAAQAGQKAEVIHWWTSGGEAAAVKVFADEFNKAGGEWIDTAIAGGGGDNARTTGISRIVGGKPPAVMQFNYGKQFDEIVKNGYVRDLTPEATAGNWKKSLPPLIFDQISRDGKVYAVPVNIHGSNWTWWSEAVLKKVGVSVPKSWDDFFPTLDKIKAAGITPIAASGQGWQLDMAWQFTLLSKGGVDLYKKVYQDHSTDAVNSAEFKDAAATWLKMRDYVDAGSTNRNWNDATAMVIQGTAGVQFMGDWAKGEFVAAKKSAGTDYECTTTFGDKGGYIYGGDIFVMTSAKDPDIKKGQDLMIKTLFDPNVQVAFNLKKGSIPARNDVDTSKVDPCGQQGIKIMADPNKQLGGADFYNTPDAVNAMRDVLSAIWSDPKATVDDFVKKFAVALKTDQ